MIDRPDLNHELADDVLGAIQRQKISVEQITRLFVARYIGPMLELAIALSDDAVSGLGPTGWSTAPQMDEFFGALAANKDLWVARGGNIGFYRTRARPESWNEGKRTYFLLKAQMAAEAAGFLKQAAQGLVGAIGEIEDNIYEHSEAHPSGIIAFQAEPRMFSFVVGDAGIGVLTTLRRSRRFAGLRDHGEALRLALSDGVSQFSDADPLRGHGFNRLFLGLASLQGSLRFASGDHALTIAGKRLALSASRLVQKPPSRGFVVSVTCGI